MFTEERDLFYLYINKPRNEPLRGKQIAIALFLIAKYFVSDVNTVIQRLIKPKKLQRPDFRGRKVVYADTSNNYEAVKFLLARYDDALLVCSGGYVGKNLKAVNVHPHIRRVNFKKYLFLIYLMLKSQYRLTHYKLILKCYGFTDGYGDLFHDNEPSFIVISNDHFPNSRALILAAEKLRIKCFYIQHASVTEVFPPLRNSHSLLYGQYSADIYRRIPGTTGTLIPVGNHRFDHHRDYVQNKKPTGKIGLAFNTLDAIDKVMEVARHLNTHFPGALVLRAHPTDRRKLDPAYEISNSKVVSSLDFLKDIDVIVAGNSSILLEAAAMNVHTFQIYFEKVPDYFVDYYGFIRTGVAREVVSLDMLVNEIRSVMDGGKFDRRATTKLYDASVGESFEFQVEDHIVRTIAELTEQ